MVAAVVVDITAWAVTLVGLGVVGEVVTDVAGEVEVEPVIVRPQPQAKEILEDRRLAEGAEPVGQEILEQEAPVEQDLAQTA
jgi:hypothetical protein